MQRNVREKEDVHILEDYNEIWLSLVSREACIYVKSVNHRQHGQSQGRLVPPQSVVLPFTQRFTSKIQVSSWILLSHTPQPIPPKPLAVLLTKYTHLPSLLQNMALLSISVSICPSPGQAQCLLTASASLLSLL